MCLQFFPEPLRDVKSSLKETHHYHENRSFALQNETVRSFLTKLHQFKRNLQFFSLVGTIVLFAIVGDADCWSLNERLTRVVACCIHTPTYTYIRVLYVTHVVRTTPRLPRTLHQISIGCILRGISLPEIAIVANNDLKRKKAK